MGAGAGLAHHSHTLRPHAKGPIPVATTRPPTLPSRCRRLLVYATASGRSCAWGSTASSSAHESPSAPTVTPVAHLATIPKGTITALHGQAKIVGGRIVLAMYNPAAALHREELRQTVVDDFTHALPAALAEARRLAAEGKLGRAAAHEDDEPPQQMTLF